MRRFTRIASIIAACLAIIGIGCLIASFSMGLTWGTFTDLMNQGKFSIQLGDSTIGFFGAGTNHSEEIHEEYKSLDIKNLEIELAAGILEIYYSDVERIQIDQEDVLGFESYIEDETLHIEGDTKMGINNGAGKIVILIPNQLKFQEVDLELGAGEAEIEGLMAEQMYVEVGAGEATIKNLTVNNLDAEVGTGELQVELNGHENDYSYDIECGIGEIQIGDNSYGGLGKTQKSVNAGADKVIDLECGIGEIQVSFTE